VLYVTTRNHQETYTAQRALRENRSPDGGFYVPMRLVAFSGEEIAAMKGKGFGASVAEVLNRLFSANLSGWDVDFCIGRNPVRLEPVGHRMWMAECWHNPEERYERLVQDLAALLSPNGEAAGSWLRIGIRVAVLFGIFGQLQQMGLESADISLVSGDFSGPISAWYARRWGLPIGNIVCCCNENGNLWDFVCHGQLKTGDVAVNTVTPEADTVVPVSLERLIYGCAGVEEVQRYQDAVRRGGNYYIDDMLLPGRFRRRSA